MRKEIMASFFLAGALLLVGLSGYAAIFNSGDNSTVQGNSNGSLLANHTVANATHAPVLANKSIAGTANSTQLQNSSNGSSGKHDSAVQNSTLDNQSSSKTQNSTVTLNNTNTTVVNDTLILYPYSPYSSSGSSSHHSSSHTNNNTVPANSTATSSSGVLHYDDCLAVSNGKVCLLDIAVDSPNDAILAVYDAKNRHISTILLAPNANRNVDLGDGKSIFISVYDTAINGSDIQALVYISNSKFDYSRETTVQGTLDIGDCINMSFSSVCLSDVAIDPPHDAILSVYDSQGRPISDVIIPVNKSKSIVIGNGRAISVKVSETMITNTSAWAVVTITYTSADFKGNLLFYDDCINTSFSSVCLKDVGTSAPHSAMFEVRNLLTGDASNIMVAPGSSEELKLGNTKAVSVYVYGTMVEGSSVWALASATDMTINVDSVTGTVGFDECIHNDAARVCLSDISMDSPHDAILAIYDSSGDLVSNKIISPGHSKTVSIDDSSSVKISVISTTFDLNTSTFGADLKIENS
ncbi:MAG: hypothetical protein NTY68_00995 [Candidatus Micrarchaeota archaeon]|nr:hypothetical protein [Candidatus Micrarchaeota archaeon]